MAYRLFLTVRPTPSAEDIDSLRALLERAFPCEENTAYFDALCGNPDRPTHPPVTAQRLGALSLLPSLLEAAGIDSTPLILRRDEHGRPYCVLDNGLVDFDFNLSHSTDHIAGALLVGKAKVGVDIEEFIPPKRALPLIRRYCTEGELSLFAGLEGKEDLAASRFTSLWTVREALAKQDGRGMPLRFDCAKIPNELMLWYGQFPNSQTELSLCAPMENHPNYPCVLTDSLPIQFR